MAGALGALGALSGIAGGVMDMAIPFIQMRESRDAQRRAIKAAIHMFQNRYQWTMNDMEKAGLNPILAYKSGVGGSGGMPGIPSFTGGSPGTGQKVMQALRFGQEMKNLKAQERATDAAAFRDENAGAAHNTQATLNRRLGEKAEADTHLSRASARKTEVDTALGATAVSGARAQQKLDETSAGELLRWINRAVRSVTGRDSTSAR